MRSSFLEDGDKVKVTIRFKGRQITHPEFGRQQMDKVVKMTSQVGQVEKPAAFEGRMMTMILSPAQGRRDGQAQTGDQAACCRKAARPQAGGAEAGLTQARPRRPEKLKFSNELMNPARSRANVSGFIPASAEGLSEEETDHAED